MRPYPVAAIVLVSESQPAPPLARAGQPGGVALPPTRSTAGASRGSSVARLGAEHYPRREPTMAETATRPTEAQVEAVVKKLAAFRDTLPEDEQRLVNS